MGEWIVDVWVCGMRVGGGVWVGVGMWVRVGVRVGWDEDGCGVRVGVWGWGVCLR